MKIYKTIQGFSMLEAIVTMVILSTTLLPLYEFFSSNITILLRVADSNRKNAATQQAFHVLDNINPMQQASGEIEFGDFTLRWESEPITAELKKSAPQKNPQDSEKKEEASSHMFVLYKMTANLLKKDEEWHRFQITKLGYKKEEEEDAQA